ncbi:barstar family protein [Actinokineospora sp. PR83]|uniref:barstar family protein n=1 Tax=Actinokineospora sp. PR83 TaxID=2884908 RepID=UPI0027DF3E4C|nr:barstar family protein [Actinokineospora sp. PR83]MCG8916491.1 barstar family protein [Actinokineospora sp. PR83]
MDVTIDGASIDSVRAFHDFVADVFDLHPYYGANPNAFWDALTGSIGRPVHIVWINAGLSRAGMGDEQFELLVRLLRDAAERDRQFSRPQLEFSLSE